MDKKEKSEGLNDRNWELLFNRYEIPKRVEAEGVFTISAPQIKEYREPRLMQTNYYTDAARYLGLLKKQAKDRTVSYRISEDGRRTFQLPYKQRQLEFCRRILSHRAFHQSLALYFRRGTMPSKCDIVSIMKQSELYRVESEETFSRRASTIKGWLNWIVSLINE